MRESLPQLESVETREKKRLPVVRVPCVTAWRSETLADIPECMPYMSHIDESGHIGLTLQLNPKDKPAAEVLVQSGHGRTAEIPGTKAFRDHEGRLFQAFVLKGIGYVDENDRGEVFAAPPRVAWRTPTDPRVKGYAHYGGLELDASLSEEFSSYRGAHNTLFRGARTVSIVRIKQMYGKETPLADYSLMDVASFARQSPDTRRELVYNKNILPENFLPAIDLRVMGVHDRCSDIEENEHEISPLQRIKNAQAFLAKDTGDRTVLSDHKQYLRHVTRRLGESLGVVHVHGTTLMGVNPANTTLAGEPVDYDSVQEDAHVNEWAYDGQLGASMPTFSSDLCRGVTIDLMDIAQYRDGATWGALPTLFQLADDMKNIGLNSLDKNEILSIFMTAYRRAYEKVPEEIETILTNICTEIQTTSTEAAE